MGDEVIAGQQVDVKPGNAMPMANMPIGTIIQNAEMKIGKGAAMVRSGRQLRHRRTRSRLGHHPRTQASSGFCLANALLTVGAVSNPYHMNSSIGKAGRSRWLGRRRIIAAMTMNPVDDPHGGGEGRTSGGRHPVTPGRADPRARTRQ